MPKRWCSCTGCPACQSPTRKPGSHGVLYDADSTGTLKCKGCQDVATARRNARPSSSSRGLGWAFTRRKQSDAPDAVAYREAVTCQCTGQPLFRCTLHTGPCRQPFTATNPKTAGHAVPRSQGGGNSPILAVCRRCNSSDGGKLAHRR